MSEPRIAVQTGHRLGRRSVLRGALGSTGGVLSLAACDWLGTEPRDAGGKAGADAGRGRSADAANNGPEAPSVAARARAGELPPVAERLPAEPLVVEPTKRIGVYGGQWQTMVSGPADTWWLDRTIGCEHLLTWSPDFSEVLPNLAADVTSQDEGAIHTISVRDGVRWSDGEPFTADDVVFAYRNVLTDPDLFPLTPSWLCDGGKAGSPPAVLDKLDEHTVRFVFGEPNAMFGLSIAYLGGRLLVDHPRHYLAHFHPEFNPDARAVAEDAGFAEWSQYFFDRADRWGNPQLPTLFPWVIQTPFGDGSRLVAVRNPFYWKTDPAGSQLPYLDRVVFDVLDDAEVMVLKISNGEIDMHCFHVMSPQNKPVLARTRESGGYHFFDVDTTTQNQMVINLNLTTEDAQLREVFRTRDFRIGLSYAIDRDELIATLYQRQGEPWQNAPRRESPYFDEEYAKQYTEYDPDRADALLDRAGLTNRDAEGFRLRQDGQRIVFTVEVALASGTGSGQWVPAMELIQGYWERVGVDVRIKSEGRSLFNERWFANQQQASVFTGEFGGRDAIFFPSTFLPTGGNGYAPAWGDWYESGGDEGEEPPPTVRDQLALFDQVKAEPDPQARQELFRRVLQISKDQFYVIGTVLPVGDYGIAANSFDNVPAAIPGSHVFSTPGPTRPEQYFSLD